jgi:hypothetical protein
MKADSILSDGAGEESRTLDLNLGKVALYQLSYSRRRDIIAETEKYSHRYFEFGNRGVSL